MALNRKNALFAGGDEGGETWAILATLIECCKLHHVEPQAYLADVVTRLVNGHVWTTPAGQEAIGLAGGSVWSGHVFGL